MNIIPGAMRRLILERIEELAFWVSFRGYLDTVNVFQEYRSLDKLLTSKVNQGAVRS